MTVADFAKTAGLSAVNLFDGKREITGGYVGDLLSWVMGNAEKGDAWVTIMTNQNVLAVASLLDLACVIVAEGSDVPDEIAALAKDKQINLLRCDRNSFEVCRELAKIV